MRTRSRSGTGHQTIQSACGLQGGFICGRAREELVAFCLTKRVYLYVAETSRLVSSVYDIRGHMNMYEDDLACRTVEDRAAMVKKYLGNKEGDLGVEQDDIRLLEDTGTGKAAVRQFTRMASTASLRAWAQVFWRKGDVVYYSQPLAFAGHQPRRQGDRTQIVELRLRRSLRLFRP